VGRQYDALAATASPCISLRTYRASVSHPALSLPATSDTAQFHIRAEEEAEAELPVGHSCLSFPAAISVAARCHHDIARITPRMYDMAV
jgi:hypothetical protein